MYGMRVDLALSGRIDQQIRNVDPFKSEARAKLHRFVAVGVTLALSIGLTTECLSKRTTSPLPVRMRIRDLATCRVNHPARGIRHASRGYLYDP